MIGTPPVFPIGGDFMAALIHAAFIAFLHLHPHFHG